MASSAPLNRLRALWAEDRCALSRATFYAYFPGARSRSQQEIRA